MTHAGIASRYANALADIVTVGSAGITADAAAAELRAFEDVMRSSPELANALVSPAVPPARKRAVVGRIGDQLKLSRIARNFLFVLIDKRRISSLDEIIQSFETVSDERLGFARADVASALPLSEPQQRALNAQLERISGKRIRARYHVDGSLIGGVVARIGSTVYDGSVRGQLSVLCRRLSTED